MNDNVIKVVDSYPSSGKTSWAINMINSDAEGHRFLFITPFLSECNRVIDSCPKKKFIQPDTRRGRGRKMNHLLQLLQEGRNIVSTHSLFANVTDDVVEVLRGSNYILILDEAFQVLDKFDMWSSDFNFASDEYKENLTRQNLETLQKKEFIEVDDNYQVRWIDEDNPLDKYMILKRLADRGLLFAIRGSLLLWSFPTEVFNRGIFADVFVLTYQFDYQIQAHYYKYFDIQYEKFYAYQDEDGEYQIAPYNGEERDLEWRASIKEKINIVDSPKMNAVGDPYIDGKGRTQYSALSKSWYNRFAESLMPVLQRRVANFFGNMTDASAAQRIWTCFSAHKELYRTRNVNPKNWIPLNSRATNQYGDRTAVYYGINRYLNPFYSAFFSIRDVPLNEDGYALSELLQWLLRSALRNGVAIDLYIPSYRMRELLKAYLDNRPLKSIYK